jgi:hypothetical protein
MTAYICKCGRIFEKNTEAATTGLRMPDYGPEHECFGCPFVCKVLTWDPVTQQQAIQNHECRGSKALRYDTTAGINVTDKCTADIYTLDFDFLRQVHEFAESLEGLEPDRYFFDNRSAVYGADGRYRYTLYPTQNQKGIVAKVVLKEHFFTSDGSRKDVAPEQEKEIVLNQIKEAKTLAQGKNTPTRMAYIHGDWRYFVDRREGKGKITAFMNSSALGPGEKTEVPTIPDFDTFEEAQNALDGFALKKKYAAEYSTPEEAPETKQQSGSGIPPLDDEFVPKDELSEEVEQAEEMNELAGRDDLGETPGAENDSSNSDNEDPHSNNDSGDSANDAPESPPPCDWKNASGADEEEPEDAPENSSDSLPDGPDLSLRLPAFDAIFNAADDALRDMARTLKTKYIESGELNLKIVIDNLGGVLRPNSKKSKGDCSLKPAKVSFSIHFPDDVEFTVDQDGRVIIPEDREHQVSFDELQPGRVIPPSGTATVDGKTGIVESYQEDGAAGQEPQADDDGPEDNEPEEKLYPCKNMDCPFYGVPDVGDAGCCFEPGNDDSAGIDVDDAIRFYRCTRPEVMQAYADNHADEDSDFEGDDAGDMPTENNENEDE